MLKYKEPLKFDIPCDAFIRLKSDHTSDKTMKNRTRVSPIVTEVTNSAVMRGCSSSFPYKGGFE